MLAAVSVGRRPTDTSGRLPAVPDAQAEAVALNLAATMLDGTTDTEEPAVTGGFDPSEAGEDADVSVAGLPDPAAAAAATPEVVRTVCGRTVGVVGYDVTQLVAIPFVLVAAGRPMKSSELCELTGHAPKSLSSVFTTSHPLVERDSGELRLRDHVWTDHGWATECVRQLAAAMQDDPDAPDARRWMHAAVAALRSIEQGPFAVVPAVREHAKAKASAWGWVDDFPAAVPARAELAFAELWLAAPSACSVVRHDDMAVELCRLAGVVPYANVMRQVRSSPWVSGSECLLAVAAEVAGDDDRALTRVQQTARVMAAREQLVASDELAEALL